MYIDRQNYTKFIIFITAVIKFGSICIRQRQCQDGTDYYFPEQIIIPEIISLHFNHETKSEYVNYY